MVRTCCVISCQSRSHDRFGKNKNDGMSYHSFPAWKRTQGPRMSELTKRRRMAWVAAVRRPNITFHDISRCMFVCSRHFHSGKPAYEMRESDPDWVPSLHLGDPEVNNADNARCKRRRRRRQGRSRPAANSAPASPTVDVEEDAAVDPQGPEQRGATPETLSPDDATPAPQGNYIAANEQRTDGEMKSMRVELNRLIEEDMTLKEELSAALHLTTTKREIYIVDLLQ